MSFKLIGHIEYEKHSDEYNGQFPIADDTQTESLERAIKLSRAFIKSHKAWLLNTHARHIDDISATLFDENETAHFVFKLVKERVVTSAEMRKPGENGTIIKTITEVIVPEHIKEQRL